MAPAPGGGLLPNGVVTIHGARMGLPNVVADTAWSATPRAAPGARAFEGLKVLDLGVIVVGAEQGRLLGDQGADVVKVESRAYPDGNRQSYLSYGLSVSFAAGHRNKRGLGLNLRDPRGRALFLDLAAKADRRFYRVEAHPYLEEPVVAERRHVNSAALADACEAPAPLAGQQSQAVVADWLGLSIERICALIAAEILEPVEPQVLAEASRAAIAAQSAKQPVDAS